MTDKLRAEKESGNTHGGRFSPGRSQASKESNSTAGEGTLDQLLAMLRDEESQFRGMQKIMEQDGQEDTAMQMRYIAAGIEHARIRIEHIIANTKAEGRA